jgi:hypothetical protein
MVCAAVPNGASRARSAGKALEESNRTLEIPLHLPQILVPKIQTIDLIGRLGRRLAYLNTDTREGKTPADPILVQLGRHFQGIARHAHMPWQQLILPLSELLATHEATAMIRFEAQSLPALNAWIDPPPALHTDLPGRWTRHGRHPAWLGNPPQRVRRIGAVAYRGEVRLKLSTQLACVAALAPSISRAVDSLRAPHRSSGLPFARMRTHLLAAR